MNIRVDSLTFRHSDSPIKSNGSMKDRNSAGCTLTVLGPIRRCHPGCSREAPWGRAACGCHGFPPLTPRGHLDIVDGKVVAAEL